MSKGYKNRGKKLSKGSTYRTGLPCVFDCGSSDALAIYKHEEEGIFSAYCHKCHESRQNTDVDGYPVGSEKKVRKEGMSYNPHEGFDKLPSLYQVQNEYIAIDDLKDRKIRADVYELFGIKHEVAADGETINKVFYPCYVDDTLKGYFVRERYPKPWPKNPDKEGILKYFKRAVGNVGGSVEMVGQQVFKPEKYKRVVIVEGCEDLVAAYKMLDISAKEKGYTQSNFAVVSVPNGTNINAIKANYEYLSGFEEIILQVDMDKQGREFAEDCCKVLPVGKVKIAELPKGFKDASDLWRLSGSAAAFKNAAKEYTYALWNAKKYSPAGVYNLSDGWSQYLKRGTEILIPFPDSFGDLNTRTFGGYALGEIVNIAAPSSVGKSSFVKEMIYKALEETQYKIGICSFEETLDEFIEGILSVHMSQQLNEIPLDMRDRETEKEKFDELCKMNSEDGSDRIIYLDHQGSLDGVELMDKINFLIRGCGCKIIYIDPVTLALSASGLDAAEFCSDIVKMVKREQIVFCNVHHVRKNLAGSKANSEGADLSEEDIFGAGAFFQTGMINLILMRNKNHENDVVRNTSKIKATKIRRHGKNTGIAGYVYYNGDTGRLERGIPWEEAEQEVEQF